MKTKSKKQASRDNVVEPLEVRVEFLRPKSVPEGLIALGIVTDVSEIQVKIQITGGIVCLVDRTNVSQAYTDLLASSVRPHSLAQMFKRGQQYVCKIIEKRARKTYAEAQDIIASLDPVAIQEDSVPATLLAIPQVPLQGAIQSVEDHGYQVDIGFKGLTGFLKYEDANDYCKEHNDGKKFMVGQIVRCCSAKAVSISEESRVVQLSMSESSLEKSIFSKEKVLGYQLTERCILPGSRSFLTVMSVQQNGLVVNFMNEFSGFVGMNHLKEEWHTPKTNYKISQQYDCTVLYYNQLTKTFALSIKQSARFEKNLAHFIKDYHVGQKIKNAEVAFIYGIKSVVFKVNNSDKAIANVNDALDEEVATMNKDELHTTVDTNFPEKSKHRCRIKSINLIDLILVISLRKEFLELPFVSVDELKAGVFIDATVKKYVKDGLVVTYGNNLRAIILNNNLNDSISAKRYPIGKTIKSRVLKVDSHKQPARVFLTNKEMLMDSTITVVDSYDRSFKGESTCATIHKVSPSGVIVELFNNVKGFIPRIFLSSEGVPAKSIGHLFEVGQVISCVVYRVDPERPSLLLGTIPLAQIVKMKRQKKEANRLKRKNKGFGLDDELNEELKEDKAPIKASKRAKVELEVEDSDSSSGSSSSSSDDNDEVTEEPKDEPETTIKSRRQRSEEARIREEKLREAENRLLDPDRQPLSIPDFERLVLKTPNSAEAWIKYSKFFIDNVETEKARIVCRRALKTISFRMEKEKLKIWLHLIKIEAKFGGVEQLREVIAEASQTNDQIGLYSGAARVLSNCGELDEAEKLHSLLLKSGNKSVDVWIGYLQFLMEFREDADQARTQFEKACKSLFKSDLVPLKSKFAQFEFRFGDVERGKTMFENLLSDNPKRTDLWKVYEGMVKKFGSRQIDNEEVRQQNDATLQRISESIELVSKKTKKINKTQAKTKKTVKKLKTK